MQSIDGILSRVLHHAPSRFSPAGEMFLIARLHNGLTIKGEMAKPHEGENYRFWGEYRDSKPPYTGQAFEFQAWEPVIEKSESGITSYLASYVDGLGKVKSAALVAAFGSETLDILRTDPTKAISVPGITAALVERIKDHFENDLSIDPVAYARLVEMFSEHRVPKRTILTLLKSFGSNAPDRVIDNPYLLLDLPRMGWETVDAIAVQTIGYPKDGPARHAAATIEGLTRHCLDGHTVAEEPEIIELAFGLMGTTPNEAGWDLCKSQGRIIEEPADSKTGTPRRFALPPIWEAEQTVASRLMSLAGTAKPLECEIPTDGLQGEQIAAVEVIKASGVTILAGAPGTGKTYVTAHVIKALLAAGMGGIRVGCPTGKAAKRAAELLAAAGIPEGRVPCTTIHRMLSPQPSEAPPGIPGDDAKVKRGRDEFSFGHGPDNPLSVDYLVIDECFAPGTLIDVPGGTLEIQKIQPRQKILNASGIDQVVAVRRKEIHRGIKITSRGKEIIASENHPFFTNRGLVFAGELRPGDFLATTTACMRWMRNDDPENVSSVPTVLQSCLQRAVVDAVPGTQEQSSQRGDMAQERRRAAGLAEVRSSQSKSRDGANHGPLSYDSARMPSKSFSRIESNGPQATHSRRKRPRSNQSRSGVAGTLARVVSSHRQDATEKRIGISLSLQVGSCQSSTDDLHRNRWSFARLDLPQGTGSEENRTSDFARVDSVEILESGDFRLDQFRDASGKLYFYDLQATRHQSFSVNGLLVHNCSMVDVKLAASVLDAVPLGTRILFVGDQNQLPSVGPGSVLRDIMETLPTVYLTEIRRSRPGRVIQACHDIIKGKTPTPADRVDIESGENWVHLEIDKPHDIAAQIVELHQAGKRFTDLLWDFQVVTPQKQRLPVACDNLNQLLSAKLNPIPAEEQNGSANLFGGAAGATADSQESRTPPFRKGDKVVRTKNGLCDQLIPLRPKVTPTTDADGFDWVAGIQNTIDPEEEYRADWGWNGRKFSIKETMIVNGDMGQVLDILRDPVKREVYVVVKFRDPDRLCRLPYGKCELIAAYAMTCHKAQGSGFPYVIVPVHDSFYWDARQNKGIFNREWIYTAMSRAEQLLVTVGQFSAIEAAVKRKTVHRRKTRLAGLLSAQQATQSDTEGTDNG